MVLACTRGGLKYSVLESQGVHLVLFKAEALQTKLMQCQLLLSPELGNCFLCFELFSQVLGSRYLTPISSGTKHQAGKYTGFLGASSLDRISHQWAKNDIAHYIKLADHHHLFWVFFKYLMSRSKLIQAGRKCSSLPQLPPCLLKYLALCYL